jgi:hypothetical protein
MAGQRSALDISTLAIGKNTILQSITKRKVDSQDYGFLQIIGKNRPAWKVVIFSFLVRNLDRIRAGIGSEGIFLIFMHS